MLLGLLKLSVLAVQVDREGIRLNRLITETTQRHRKVVKVFGNIMLKDLVSLLIECSPQVCIGPIYFLMKNTKNTLEKHYTINFLFYKEKKSYILHQNL